MKLNLRLKICILVLSISGIFSLANAQSRYKHIPRVKVDKPHRVITKTKNEFSTLKQEIVELNTQLSLPVVTQNILPAQPEELTVASVKTNPTELKLTPKETKIHATNNTFKTQKKVLKTEAFTKKIKKNARLFEIKNIKKTNANIPLILMIAFYITGVILMIIAVLMLAGIITGVTFTGFLIVLIIGAVLLLAASVLLTLLKLGIF